MKYHLIFRFSVLGMLLTFSMAATAQKFLSAEEEIAEGKIRRGKQIEVLRKIINSRNDPEMDWWKKEHDVKFVVKSIESDVFYRWSRIEILKMAKGDVRGIQPIPSILSDKLLKDFGLKGFGSQNRGSIHSSKGVSEKLEEIGIFGLSIENFVKEKGYTEEPKTSLFHVSFTMWFFNVSHAEGWMSDIWGRVHPENPMAMTDPLVFYEKLNTNESEDFFVISIPNTVWDEKKCTSSEIVVAKCIPFFGGFDVDYFHLGE